MYLCKALTHASLATTRTRPPVSGQCRGIGPIGTWTSATEIFGWRQIENGRRLGGLVGLVPAPYQSGESAPDQGISRAGNKHVRRLILQLAWGWVRYQPDSALTQ